MPRVGRRGFSLTEMVVVMAILMILYGISMIYITVLTNTRKKVGRIVEHRDSAQEAYLRRTEPR